MAKFGQDAEKVRKVGNEAIANGDALYKNYQNAGNVLDEYAKKTKSKAIANQVKNYFEEFMPNTVEPIRKSYKLLGETLIKISKDIEERDQ